MGSMVSCRARADDAGGNRGCGELGQLL